MSGSPHAASTRFGLLLGCVGCASSLEGDWAGELDCGPDGAFEARLRIDPQEGEPYPGEGTIEDLPTTLGEGDLLFGLTVRQPQAEGAQDLDLRLSDCRFIVGSGTADGRCADPEHTRWDGEDTLRASFVDFPADHAACDLGLRR